MRETKALHEIAQDMIDWCLMRGCQQLRETDKEITLTCPNLSCPSRDKSETHKSFDINKETALYHCWHCGLKGIGLDGPKGLKTQLESGDFLTPTTTGKILYEPREIFTVSQSEPSKFFKPKERIEMTPVMSREEVGRARAKGICDEAAAYFIKRGIPELVFRDHDLLIFSYPKGKQLSFMKQPLNDTAVFFPIRNENGEVVHVHYKLINGGYYMSPGPKPIYLTKACLRAKRKETAFPKTSGVIVVVEGVFDALSVYVAGFQGAALLGHEITSNHDLSVFDDKNVVVMLDNDEPGQLSVEKVASSLVSMAKEVRIAEIPAEIEGHKVKDANDVLMIAGTEKLKEIIEGAKVYDSKIFQPKNSEATEKAHKSDLSGNTKKIIDISKLRKKLGLSQREFAEQLGVTKRTIIRWESGIRTPDQEFQQKLLQLEEEVAGVTEVTGVTTKEVTEVTDKKVTEVTGEVTDTNRKKTEVNPPTIKVAPPTKDKPKEESAGGIVFPEKAWRGIFETYRQAQEGTTEAPDQYHFAVFKTIAGTVIGRSCYLWNGRYLYPNFFTVLIGPTKKSRKTTAKSRGESLLADTDALVIIQRGLATPEGLIGRLQIPPAEELDGLPEIEQQRAMSVSEHEGYRMLVVCNEFASLLKKAKKESSSGLIQVLTDAYDCQDSLDNPTRISPLSARKPFVSMIGLSTKEWLEANLDVDDIHGGFVNRNTFYLWTPTQPMYNPRKVLESPLNEVKRRLHERRQSRKGMHIEYTFSYEADAILKEWYDNNYYAEYDSDIVSAASQRIDENVRKLALLYAVLENNPDDAEIKADQLQAAIAVGEYWEATAMEIFGKFGSNKATRDEMRIIEALLNNPMTKRDLHRKFCSNMSAKQLDSAIKNLVSVERIGWITERYKDTAGKKRNRKLLKLLVDD